MKKVDERLTKLEVKGAEDRIMLKGISETLKSLDEKMTGLDHVIRGNGSPGMKATVDAIAVRVVSLEEKRSKWRDLAFTVGGGVLVGLLLNYLKPLGANHVNQPSVSQVQQKP